MRSLYDQDFLDNNGCPEEGFDPQYNFDNTTFTWVTNIVVVGICFMAALKFALWPNIREPSGEKEEEDPNYNDHDGRRTSRFCMIGYFATIGISNFGAVFYHALIESNQDDRIDLLNAVMFFFQGLTGMFLVLAALRMVTANILVISAVALACFAFAIVAVMNLYILVFFFIAVELPFAIVVYSLQACKASCHEQRNMNILKAIGVTFFLSSFVAYLLLVGRCGSEEAYQVCFEDCPFSDLSKFNHNGLAHILTIIGHSLVAIGEDRFPSHAMVRRSDQAKNETVISNENTNEEEEQDKEENQHCEDMAA